MSTHTHAQTHLGPSFSKRHRRRVSTMPTRAMARPAEHRTHATVHAVRTSVHASVCTSVHASVHAFVYASVHTMRASMHAHRNASMRSSVRGSVRTSMHANRNASVRTSVHPYVHASVHTSVHPYVHTSVCHVSVVCELALGRGAVALSLFMFRLFMAVSVLASVSTMPTRSDECGSAEGGCARVEGACAMHHATILKRFTHHRATPQTYENAHTHMHTQTRYLCDRDLAICALWAA